MTRTAPLDFSTKVISFYISLTLRKSLATSLPKPVVFYFSYRSILTGNMFVVQVTAVIRITSQYANSVMSLQ